MISLKCKYYYVIIYNKQHTMSYSCRDYSHTLPAASVCTLFQASGTHVTLFVSVNFRDPVSGGVAPGCPKLQSESSNMVIAVKNTGLAREAASIKLSLYKISVCTSMENW